MKILYAIQATGNGHISRATQLLPYIRKYGHVDTFVSGDNATLQVPFDVQYRSKGLSLYYGKCGKLSYSKIFKNTNLLRVRKEVAELPVEKYDVIINDFEAITSLACQKRKVPSVQFGHQASFMSKATPRPEQKNVIGEFILKNYAKTTQYIGLHFQPYADFIFPPVIKPFFMNATPSDKGHITVYLPAFQQECIEQELTSLPDVHFHFFLPEIKTPYKQGNISYKPVSHHLFNESLLGCHGIITGGGFETPSEALFLGKRLMSIPIKGQYEQYCNAAALKQMGVCIYQELPENFAEKIQDWLTLPQPNIQQKANNIEETLRYLFDTYPYKK